MARQVTLAAYETLDSITSLIENINNARNGELKGTEKQVMDQALERVTSFKNKLEDLYSLLIKTYGDPIGN